MAQNRIPDRGRKDPCRLEDYKKLKMLPSYSRETKEELALRHDFYLPIKPKGTVLDVGAGCGETAKLYLNHGAGKVIAIEREDEAYKCLCENFKNDKRVIPIQAEINNIKIDIEGAEEGMVLEIHFPYKLKRFRSGFTPGKHDEVVLLRFDRNKGITGEVANIFNLGVLGIRKLLNGNIEYKDKKRRVW